MGSKFWPKGGVAGVLHHYTETLVAFEFAGQAARKPHSLLFIGGLGDGLATTSYLADLTHALQPTQWSLFAVNLTSSYQAWGFGHLDRDTNEVAECINYVKEYKTNQYGSAGKVVLMGHSTGSQNVLHYLHRPNPHSRSLKFDPELKNILRPAVDGAIMQAPISDREAILYVKRDGFMGKTSEELEAVYEKLITMAKEAVAQNQWDTMLPIWMTSQFGYPSNTPVSCRRFLSLVSPESPCQPGEDDLFSSDLSDDHLRSTFGIIRKQNLLRHKLLVLYSGADQAVPDWVDKENLLKRWESIANEGGRDIWDTQSGLIPNASHALSNDDQADPRAFLNGKVLNYIQTVEKL